MAATQATAAARTGRAGAGRRFREGWLHLCNGLDPVRDGGMVPSILGMAGTLAEQGGDVTIVTPTPSRLGDTAIPPRLTLRGPEADLEDVVRGAEVVHMHGLWQGHTRRGARAARRAGVPYLITAHGHAEPWAMRHKAWKKKVYTALVEGKNLRRASCLHAPVTTRGRTPPRDRAGDADLLRPQRRPPRPVRRPAPAHVLRGRIPRAGRQVPAAVLRPPPSEEGPRPARRGVRPAERRPPRPAPAPGRQRRRGARPVPRPRRGRGPVVAGDVGRPRLGRARPPGLGRGRRLHPAQLQRGLQHGDSGGAGLPPADAHHHRLPLPRAGRVRRRDRRPPHTRRRDRRAARSSWIARPPSAPRSAIAAAPSSSAGTPGTSRPVASRPPIAGWPAEVPGRTKC